MGLKKIVPEGTTVAGTKKPGPKPGSGNKSALLHIRCKPEFKKVCELLAGYEQLAFNNEKEKYSVSDLLELIVWRFGNQFYGHAPDVRELLDKLRD